MADNRKRVAIVLHRVGAQPWGAMVKNDMCAALADHPEISATFADPEGQVDRQIQILDDHLKCGVDVLIVCPIDGEKLRPILREYKKAGVPVIVLANDPGEPELFQTLIMADNRQYGCAVGDLFVEVMDGVGDLVEIVGVRTASSAADRSAGFREAIVASPGMQIIDQCAGDLMFDRAREEFAQILSRQKKIDGVFAHNDEMAGGAWEAAQAVGREQEMLIVGIDAIQGERGIRMVVQGRLAATFINPSSGRAAIDALLVILGGGACLPRRLLRTSPLRSNERIRSWQQHRKR